MKIKTEDCLPLEEGDVIQRGDFFVDDDQVYEMDRTGKLLGVRCLNKKLEKAGGWFRPLK